VKCSEVLPCSDGTTNKESNIIKRHIDNRKLLLICILLLSHSLIFLCSIVYQYMVVFLFNTVICLFLLLILYILIVRLLWLRFFLAFSSVVRQMPGYNSPRRGVVHTLPKLLCCSMYCFILCRSMYYLCVNVSCTTATGWQRNWN